MEATATDSCFTTTEEDGSIFSVHNLKFQNDGTIYCCSDNRTLPKTYAEDPSDDASEDRERVREWMVSTVIRLKSRYDAASHFKRFEKTYNLYSEPTSSSFAYAVVTKLGESL
jgi:hypothetical protein